MTRVFKPFSWSLWASIALTAVLVGLITACDIEGIDHSELHARVKRFKDAPVGVKVYWIAQGAVDGIYGSSMDLFGAGSTVTDVTSLGARCLKFGWGFLILIVVAAYTANLAAFLTTARRTASREASFEREREREREALLSCGSIDRGRPSCTRASTSVVALSLPPSSVGARGVLVFRRHDGRGRRVGSEDLLLDLRHP